MRRFNAFNYDPADSVNPERPHRHNFQELLWIRSGRGRQTIDGEVMEIAPATFYLIAKGQVHHFQKAEEIDGYVLRFGDDFGLERGDGGKRHFSEMLFNNVRTVPSLSVDDGRISEFDELLSFMFREFKAPRGAGKFAILRNLLQALLIKVAQGLGDGADAPDRTATARDGVFMDFLALLEDHYKGHHGVAFYADALAVTPRQLSDRTSRMIGKTAKQVIEERIALEAKRAFKFTEKPVKEVAYDLGYDDPSYFSKVFKRVTGHSPQEFQAL